jgi:hypothetical protein
MANILNIFEANSAQATNCSEITNTMEQQTGFGNLLAAIEDLSAENKRREESRRRREDNRDESRRRREVQRDESRRRREVQRDESRRRRDESRRRRDESRRRRDELVKKRQKRQEERENRIISLLETVVEQNSSIRREIREQTRRTDDQQQKIVESFADSQDFRSEIKENHPRLRQNSQDHLESADQHLISLKNDPISNKELFHRPSAFKNSGSSPTLERETPRVLERPDIRGLIFRRKSPSPSPKWRSGVVSIHDVLLNARKKR